MRIADFPIIWLHASGVPSFPPHQKTDCAKDDGKVAACRSMQRKMRRLNQPESVDEFFTNLHERGDDDMLRDSAFYDSGDFLLKAFGLAGILGCHVYSFDDGKTVQLNCDQKVLIALYGRDLRASAEPLLSETGQYALLDDLYRRFRDVFGGGWQRVDAFDKKHDEGFLFDPRPRSGLPDDFRLQQERMVWQKTFHSLPE